MTTARSQIVVEGEVGVYHTQPRCVRLAFLCGQDESTGRTLNIGAGGSRHEGHKGGDGQERANSGCVPIPSPYSS